MCQWPLGELDSLVRLWSPGNNAERATGETAYSLAANFRHVRLLVLTQTDRRPECETAVLQHPTVTSASPALVSRAPAIDRVGRLGASRPQPLPASDPNQTIREGPPSSCRCSSHDGNPRRLPRSRIERCTLNDSCAPGSRDTDLGSTCVRHSKVPLRSREFGGGISKRQGRRYFSCCVASDWLEPLRQGAPAARDLRPR